MKGNTNKSFYLEEIHLILHYLSALRNQSSLYAMTSFRLLVSEHGLPEPWGMDLPPWFLVREYIHALRRSSAAMWFLWALICRPIAIATWFPLWIYPRKTLFRCQWTCPWSIWAFYGPFLHSWHRRRQLIWLHSHWYINVQRWLVIPQRIQLYNDANVISQLLQLRCHGNLPNATLIAGACPVLNSAGTAKIPHNPKNEAVILYRLIVSAKGPVQLYTVSVPNPYNCWQKYMQILPIYTNVFCTSLVCPSMGWLINLLLVNRPAACFGTVEYLKACKQTFVLSIGLDLAAKRSMLIIEFASLMAGYCWQVFGIVRMRSTIRKNYWGRGGGGTSLWAQEAQLRQGKISLLDCQNEYPNGFALEGAAMKNALQSH